MQLNLAILTVLSLRPEGRATLDELKREIDALAAKEEQAGDLFSHLPDIDIFQSRLVIREHGGFSITGAGRSALKALNSPRKSVLNLPPKSHSHSLNLMDDVVGTEERRKVFDLDPHRLELTVGKQNPMNPTIDTVCDPVVERLGTGQVPGEAADEHADRLPLGKFMQTDIIKSTAPPRAQQHSDRKPFVAFLGFFAAAATKARTLGGLWRGHVVHANPKTHRLTRSAVKLTRTFLSLATVFFAGAAAALALVQLKSLKTEVATLHRELGSLKGRFAGFEHAEKTKLETDHKNGDQIKVGADKRAKAEPNTDQSALNLSLEEIQLIREFIKLSPAGGMSAPAIKVGDPVGVATIPLPSPLMEKVPKLLGGRFTTQNGSIIILRRDSGRADAVLPPG